jgi:3-oxoacyl-[acyl-carrier protein] reductase
VIELRGRRAIVTGGSRGIGAATARALAACGARVVIGYRHRASEAARVVEQIRGAGGDAYATAADLGTEEGAALLFSEAVREMGGVDLVIASAGTWPAEEMAIAGMPESRWRSTMRDNLDAVYRTVRHGAAQVSDGGCLVLLSSTAGQRGESMHADYAAAKGAVIALVKSLALELAPRQVRVNAVAPGWVDTEMIASAVEGGSRSAIEQGIPLGRIASAEDVAGPILFLCSGLARHITGEVLNVNGGSVLCG